MFVFHLLKLLFSGLLTSEYRIGMSVIVVIFFYYSITLIGVES